MKLLKPTWVNHNAKPIFSVDIHPDGTKFATGGQGQDSGKVVIWNMAPVVREEDEKNENVPKMLSCVNCVRWSNNGIYLASGGDDKLIMVWKRAAKLANVEQWRCVSILRSHTGDVMDVAWSPHDAWLASCSVDNTVVIWNALKFPEILATLKGHSGLVKGLTWDPVGKYIASQADDRSLKVWRTMDWQLETSITKPFDECGGTTHVLRISWSPDGHYLVSAHAMNNSGPTAQIIERDGWKTNMDFVGHRKAVTVVSTYGKSLAIMTEAHLSTAIIENPEMLKYQQRQQQMEKKNEALRDGIGPGVAVTAPKLASMVNGESLEDIRKNLLKKQVETRTADGRRRITPLCIAQLDTGDFSTALFNSIPLSGSLAGSMMSASQTNQLIALDYNTANSLGTAKPALEPMAAAAKSAEDVANKDGVNATSASAALPASSSSVLSTSSKIEPMKAFDSRFTERSKATSGTSPVSHANQVTLDSSDSEEKLAIKPLSLSKRKLDLEVEKKKKGRPRKDSRLMPVTLTVQSPAILASEKDGACHSTPLALKLPTPVLQKSFALQVSSDPSMYIEVENEITAVGGSKLSRLKCNRDGKEWETLLTSRILSAAGSWVLHHGSHHSGHPIGLEREEADSGGSETTVSQILLTQHGIPLMNMSDGKAYCFNPSLSSWNLVSDKQEMLAQCADFRSSLPSQEAMLCSGPLAIIQGRMSNSGRQAAKLFSMPHLVQQETTTAYLENQVASALALQSSHEYRFEYRLRELCKDLLGPVHSSSGSQWESTVVGLRKRDLLKELLPVIGQNLRFQRLFTEYQEQLDLLKDK
ncbi:hypothetical protein Chor_013121 [Crotalus horridus]